MTLEIHELVQLSGIARSLWKSDPEFARTLSVLAPKRRRPVRETASVAVLAACAVLSLAGLATGDTAISAIGGGVALTVYPFLLVMSRTRPSPTRDERV